MMEKQQTKLPTGQEIKWKEKEFPSIYANIMGIGMSPFDIAMMFGEIVDTTFTEITAIPKAKIILSPEQASNLMKLLQFALSNYVKNNGQLRSNVEINPDFLATSQVEAQTTKIGK
jgi:hypothetical protein